MHSVPRPRWWPVLCECLHYIIGLFSVGSCTSHMTIQSGDKTISSPNHPKKYNNLTNCLWILEGPVGKKLQLDVSPSPTLYVLQLSKSFHTDKLHCPNIMTVSYVMTIPFYIYNNIYICPWLHRIYNNRWEQLSL